MVTVAVTTARRRLSVRRSPALTMAAPVIIDLITTGQVTADPIIIDPVIADQTIIDLVTTVRVIVRAI